MCSQLCVHAPVMFVHLSLLHHRIELIRQHAAAGAMERFITVDMEDGGDRGGRQGD